MSVKQPPGSRRRLTAGAALRILAPMSPAARPARPRLSVRVPAILLFLALLSCDLFRHGPAVPTIEGRYAGRDSTALWVRVSVSSPEPRGDTLSYQVVWGEGDTEDWTDPLPDDSSITLTHTWYAYGRYPVRARSRDTGGRLSGWSAEHEIVILPNGPPWKPEPPEVPGYWQTDTSLRVFVSTRDREGDSVAFRISWGDGDTTSWTGFVPSGSGVEAEHAYSGPGDFDITVQARDTRQAPSAWSKPAPLRVLGRGSGLRWRFATGEPVYYGPAIGTDGTVYTTLDGRLAALGPDGELLWTCEPAPCANTPTVGPDGTIYCGSEELHAVGPDGSLRWSYPAGPGNNSVVVAADGTVGYGSGATFITVNPDGSLRWFYDTPALIWSSAAIGPEGTFYFGANDSNLHSLNPDGTALWTAGLGERVTAAPALDSDGTIYAASDDGRLHALTPAGELAWSHDFGAAGYVRSPVIGEDGTVYVGAPDHILYALSPTGRTRWRYGIGDLPGRCPAVAADGTVYTGSVDGHLYAFFPDGTLKWRYRVEDGVSSPVTIGPDGTVFFGSADGWLYALEGSAPPAASPWPMFQQNPQHTGRNPGR